VQPWYVLWGLTLLGATKLDRRVGLVAAGACFWLSMMIAPQGSNLFLEVPPVLAMATAAAVATFAVLGVLPLVFLAEVGFTVAFGVLLDTFLVRSVLVPALCTDIGARIWWPSALARGAD